MKEIMLLDKKDIVEFYEGVLDDIQLENEENEIEMIDLTIELERLKEENRLLKSNLDSNKDFTKMLREEYRKGIKEISELKNEVSYYKIQSRFYEETNNHLVKKIKTLIS